MASHTVGNLAQEISALTGKRQEAPAGGEDESTATFMAEEDTGCADDGKSQSEEIPVAKVVLKTSYVRKGPSFSHCTIGHVQSGIALYGHVVGDGNWLHLKGGIGFVALKCVRGFAILGTPQPG